MSNAFLNFKMSFRKMQGKYPVEIKNLSQTDFQAQRSLLIDIYLSGYQSMQIYAYRRRKLVKHYLNWLYRGNPEGFFVAMIGKELVGFIACHANWKDHREGKVCEIHEFVIKEEFKGKGIGKALLEKAIEYALSTGNKKITLWVGEKNERAIDIYKKAGFHPLYKAKGWIRMKREI